MIIRGSPIYGNPHMPRYTLICHFLGTRDHVSTMQIQYAVWCIVVVYHQPQCFLNLGLSLKVGVTLLWDKYMFQTFHTMNTYNTPNMTCWKIV